MSDYIEQEINYKKLYFFLFNGITDVINKMEERNEGDDFICELQMLQLKAEEIYIEME